MTRLLCRLLGCSCDPDFPCCNRCGTDLYDDYLERGWLDPLFRLWCCLRSWTWPRCTQCGRSLLFRRRVSDEFCSKQCHDKWLPF